MLHWNVKEVEEEGAHPKREQVEHQEITIKHEIKRERVN
jgi:hypothetical protein